MSLSKQNRRIARNLSLTKKFRSAYFGPWVNLSIFLLGSAYGLMVVSVLLTPGVLLPTTAPVMLILGAAATVILSAAVLTLGAVCAHRVGGVHIKLAQAFQTVAEGDFAYRIQFRYSDRLESVAEAFNGMLDSIKEGVPPEAPEPSEEVRQRRSLRSLGLTRRYQVLYMGIWLFITLALILLNRLLAANALAFADLESMGLDLDLSVVVLNILGVCLSLLTTWAAINNAHQIAGVHIKLEKLFKRIRQGERQVELKFRARDNLPELEAAFAKMLEAIRNRENPREQE